MDQIRDKDLALAMLNDLKFTCDCINQKILEVSNPQLRQKYLNVLSETYDEHNQLYNLMHQRGWYKTMNATQQELSQIINSVNTMQNEMMQNINTTSYQQYNQQQPYQQQHHNQGHQPY
jgi:spore coat protein CotF